MFKTPFETRAMVHSLNGMAKVTIIHFNNNNSVVAQYKGNYYSAVFNPYTWMFYVDDVYGNIQKELQK